MNWQFQKCMNINANDSLMSFSKPVNPVQCILLVSFFWCEHSMKFALKEWRPFRIERTIGINTPFDGSLSRMCSKWLWYFKIQTCQPPLLRVWRKRDLSGSTKRLTALESKKEESESIEHHLLFANGAIENKSEDKLQNFKITHTKVSFLVRRLPHIN